LLGVRSSDIEIHTSLAHAHSPLGPKTLSRCQAPAFTTKIHGATDIDCDEKLVKSSSYLIDLHHITNQGLTWFLQHSQPGLRENNMLTNPKYDVAKHGLVPRARFSVWSRNSGCFHGNYTWRCGGCGGKCKRGRCKVDPRPEMMVPEWLRLPRRGSVGWRELLAEESCKKYWRQCDNVDYYSTRSLYHGASDMCQTFCTIADAMCLHCKSPFNPILLGNSISLSVSECAVISLLLHLSTPLSANISFVITGIEPLNITVPFFYHQSQVTTIL
jgi:hypothetical protein